MTLIDNIFIDNNRTYTIHPLPNGLSDHDGQNLTILNLPIPSKHIKFIHTTFDNDSITQFKLQLSYEQWDNVFGNSNINIAECTIDTFDPGKLQPYAIHSNITTDAC